MYRAFYNIMRIGEPVEAGQAETVSLQQVIESLFPLIKEDREYLGLVDSHGTTLQMLYEAENDEFRIEVPRPDLDGAYGARLDYEDVQNLLSALPTEFPVDGFDGFSFEAWPD